MYPSIASHRSERTEIKRQTAASTSRMRAVKGMMMGLMRNGTRILQASLVSIAAFGCARAWAEARAEARAGAWSQASPPPTSAAPAGETPAQAAARITARLRELETEIQAELSDGADPRETARTSGVTNARTQRWLADTAPLLAEYARIQRTLPPRALDYSQGFELLLPHLSDLRQIARAFSYATDDAALRGDHAALLRSMDAQAFIVQNATADGLTISSLVGMACARLTHDAIARAIDSGSVDADTARAMLASTAPLGKGASYRLDEAMQREGDALRVELGRLQELTPEQRATRLNVFNATSNALPLSDADLAKASEMSTAYYSALGAAIANPDRAAGRAALAALDKRLLAGEFGELVKALAPATDKVLDRIEATEREYAELRATLQALADGTKQPADFVNAAPLYVAAASAMRRLDAEAQRGIEAVRVARAEMPESMRADARHAIDSLRADVIDRLLRASKCGRCVFDDSARREPAFTLTAMLGANGAARLLLDDAPDSLDSVLAALAMMRHYASAGGFGRALVAQAIARDVAAALAELDARKPLDADARAKIAAELAKIRADDPFGFQSAVKFERARLAAFRSPGVFESKSLAGLSANTIAFLVAVTSPASPALSKDPCNCAFDGPMLAIRGWFDLDALAAARAQAPRLVSRAPNAAPLAGLDITTPIDIDARIVQSADDIARLQAFAKTE